MSKNFYKRFAELKTKVQVNKDQRNSFGKFNYRTKEGIFEATKPHEKELDILIHVDNELVVIAERLFVKATAFARDLEDGEVKLTATSYAEFQHKQGTQMNESQLSGSAESYAGKYALGNLLGLDDNKDADNEVLSVKQENKPQEKGMTINYKKEPKEVEVNVDQEKVDTTQITQRIFNTNNLEGLENILKELEPQKDDETIAKLINITKSKINKIKGE